MAARRSTARLAAETKVIVSQWGMSMNDPVLPKGTTAADGSTGNRCGVQYTDTTIYQAVRYKPKDFASAEWAWQLVEHSVTCSASALPLAPEVLAAAAEDGRSCRRG